LIRIHRNRRARRSAHGKRILGNSFKRTLGVVVRRRANPEMQVRGVGKDLGANARAETNVETGDIVEKGDPRCRELEADACGDLEEGTEASGAGYCYGEEFEEAAGAGIIQG
jgi:hypothetical protein